MPPLEVPPALQPPEQITQLDDGLGSGFLKGIPDEDRLVVEKYIKDWDSGVTKKFQSIHDEYKPYKDLGDIEELETGLQILQALRLDPKAFYQQLTDLISSLEEDSEMPEVDPQKIEAPVGTIDPNEFAQLKAAYEYLSTKWSAHEQTQTEQAQIAELDNYMKTLHTEHGDFDDEWVLVRMANGEDAVEAIKAWNALIEDRVSSRKGKPAPVVLPGSGSIPGGQVDPSKLDKKDRLAYVTAMLEQAKQQQE